MSSMNRRDFAASCWATSLLASSAFSSQESPPSFVERVRSKSARGSSVVATVHPLATHAAIQILQRGGTAVDAIVAAATTLSVVDGHNSGIGGGCFLLIHTKEGEVLAIDGREKAPAAATHNMFLKDGKPDVRMSQTGPLACGVPGEIAALELAHRRVGKLPWSSLLESAIDAAERGYLIGSATARAIQDERETLRTFPDSASVLLHADGSPKVLGEKLVQADLAETMRKIARGGSDWFYRGEFAKRASDFLLAAGGMIRQSDFAAYEAKLRTPLKTQYRGNTIYGFPPPSSGGIHIAQMLMMLERFPLKEWFSSRPQDFYHVLAEAMKLAFADRAYWLGDSDFAQVPKGLIEQAYVRSLADRIDIDRATLVPKQGLPPNAENELFPDRKHTTHLTAADAEGNWVAMTATVNTTWGNKMIVPGTGVMLNNQMDDFSIAPGVPNAFGLIGADANRVEGGKRPLSSMSPTIVVGSDGKPRLTCGAAGGPKIINATLQIILHCLDLGKSIEDAIGSTRIHHQWTPDQILYEPTLEKGLVESLEQKGHRLKSLRTIAVAQGIERIDNELFASGDPRVDSAAAGIGL